MRESIHRTVRAADQAKAIELGRRAGYCSGGAVEESEDAVKRMARKKGGAAKVHGKETKSRLDKKPRKAFGGPMGDPAGLPTPAPVTGAPPSPPMTQMPMKKGGATKKARGGSANTAYHEGVRTKEMSMKEPTVNVDSERPKRAMGGHVGHAKKHKTGKTNIIIHAGGGGDQANPQALQQAKMEGMKQGAMMVVQKLKGAGAPMGGPPGGGAPPMGAPPAAPPGGGPMGPMAAPMRARGGKVRETDPNPKLHPTPATVKVTAHK